MKARVLIKLKPSILDAQGASVKRALDGLGFSDVRDVRVKGAIGVVELEREPKLEALRARFVERGVWVRPFGNVVYLMPPLVIGAEDLATLTAIYRRLIESYLGQVPEAAQPVIG